MDSLLYVKINLPGSSCCCVDVGVTPLVMRVEEVSTNQLARRQLKQTLESQQQRVAEQSESEYANILRQLSTTLGQGFRASAGILQEGGTEAMYDPNQQYSVGQTEIRNGQLVYWNGTEFVSEEEYMDMIQQGDTFG